MAEETKVVSKVPAHDEADCNINDYDHLDPSVDDCGHYVPSGPGTVDTPDLNTYEEKNGSPVIVADGPSHNLDQDPTHGPGVA